MDHYESSNILRELIVFPIMIDCLSNIMTSETLKKYVSDARTFGLSSEQIVDELVRAGWHMHDIADVVIDRPEEAGVPPVISVQNVSKSYGKIKALDDVTLEIPRGSVTAILGPNGAGKTTLVRILATLLTPDTGRVTVAGFNVVRDAKKLRSIIGLAGQYAAVDETLTGRENLEMVGRLYHLNAYQAKFRAQELLQQFDLENAADRILKTYSGGMRRRLDLAASLVIRPKILFLDEPTTGLDPRSRQTLWNVIRDLVQFGTTVLLTTQYMEEAERLAHHIFVMDHGGIIANGTPDDLKRQVGGDILEIHMANHDEASRALEIIGKFGNGEPHADSSTGLVAIPFSGDASILVSVIREFDSAGLRLADIVLRRPTLDDVFMKLTGRKAEEKKCLI